MRHSKTQPPSIHTPVLLRQCRSLKKWGHLKEGLILDSKVLALPRLHAQEQADTRAQDLAQARAAFEESKTRLQSAKAKVDALMERCVQSTHQVRCEH